MNVHLALSFLVLYSFCVVIDSRHDDYLNSWAVKINGDDGMVENIAQHYGYDLVRKIDGFENLFMFRKRDLQHREKREATNLTAQLAENPAVIWAEQQQSAIRVKRSVVRSETQQVDTQHLTTRQAFNQFFDATRQFVFSFGFQQNNLIHKYNDELWPFQWYLHPSGLTRFDHGITKAWEMGYTGRGIVVSVLDDGLEWKHHDIRSNYDHNASFDMNDDDSDPTPRYDNQNSNAHGTRCAGEIAMSPQNRICGVGVAFNARVGGIRCLDGDVSDLIEARSLSFKNDYIDIYSSSWGPNDDGRTVDGPKALAMEALERGVTFGRKGRGNIYVWASGNGGSRGDNCNCDGYVSSIYTISIGSVSESGQFPWYGEKCASTLAVAYSSGAYNDKKIATTDIHNRCTLEHSGTSAAAPIAAGILALALEANPDLTWRDIQHMIVCTSEFSPLVDNRGWKRNAAGFLYNSRFGFGLLMAPALVKAALNWHNIPQKTICVIRADNQFPIRVDDGTSIKVLFSNIGKCQIKFLEHVQVKTTLEASRRGNLRVFMFSPQDTLSVLMQPRFKDNSNMGFREFNLTSVQYWGENPEGDWRFYVQNTKRDGSMAMLTQAELILHGITEASGCLKEKPFRRYLNEELISTIIDQTPENLEDIAHPQNNFFSNTLDQLLNIF